MSHSSSPPSAPSAKRIVRGGVWVAARFGVVQLGGLVQVLVIARILPPQDIGLLGIAMMIMTVAGALTQTGFEAAVIQRKDLSELELHVAWSAMLLRGLALGAGMAALSPLLARFFEEPEVGPIVIALAAITALEGLTSMSVALFRRELSFRRIFFLQSGSQVIELVVSVTLALVLRSVWALVIGRAAGAALRILLSYLMHSYRPRFALDRTALDSLVSYGKWVTLSSTTSLALQNCDTFYIAKMLGPEQLAYFHYAYRLSNLPAATINEVLGVLMFPAFVAMRAQPSNLSALLGRAFNLTVLVALPATVLISVLSLELTLTLLGPKWLPVAELTRWLALFGLLRALGAPAIPYFMATNRPALRAKLQLVQLAIFALAVVPLGARYGATGVAIATTLYGTVGIFSAALSLRLAQVSVLGILRPLGHAALAAAAAGFSVFGAAQHASDASFIALAGLGLLGLAVYFAVLAGLDALTGGSYRKELRQLAGHLGA